MMFQSEMENLELGLCLGSSDLLFPDELFNVPIPNNGSSSGKSEQEDLQDALKKEEENSGNDIAKEDLLQQVMDEIKMAPMDIEMDVDLTTNKEQQQSSEDSTMKSIMADYDDLVFEEPPQFKQALSPSASSSSSLSNFGGEEEDDTMALIGEMEEFLCGHEALETDKDKAEPDWKKEITDMERKQAEEIVDALVKGDISLKQNNKEEQCSLAESSGLAANAIGATISNISEIVTKDGQRIVIVIANDQQQKKKEKSESSSSKPVSVAEFLPSPGSPGQDSSDSEWSPESPVATRKGKSSKKSSNTALKKKTSSSGRISKRASPAKYDGVKDKKERKKLQNVVAARRYRDKKKSELQEMEEEEDELKAKNENLKERLEDLGSELKTLKKLMVELGMVKVSPLVAAALA